MKIRIGHLSTFYHTSMLLMAQGTLSKDFDVEWRLFGTGPAIVNAFGKGELDLAYIGLPPAIIGIDKGIAIKCIAGGHIEGTVIAGHNKHNGFPEIEDLGEILKQFTGLKIGVPGRGSIHDVIITEYLERFNLRDQMEIINFQWADQVTEAMAKGMVSAAVGTPALAVAIGRYAHGKILYPPSKTWPDNPSYGILAGVEFLRTERGVIEEFLALHEEATSLLRNRPKEAAGIISDYVGFIDKEFVFDVLKISPRYCAQITDDYIASTMEFVGAQKRIGYIAREILPDEIFDPSIIRKIHPEKDHYRDGISV